MENNVKVAWPGWEAVQLIGRGSFGSVYEIQRTVFNNTESSALKVISIPQNGSDIEEMYNDGYDSETITSTIQNHLQNIVSEYSMMKKMNDCVNIVNCEDLKYEAKEKGIGFDVYIKMELLTPLVKSLPEIITDDIVIKLAKDMCNALNVCKEYGVIHRDIKPQNIFVSKYGDYKLGDFGIAKTVEKTMGGTKIGTYKYMAPEVYNNQPYGSSADIYSLGLVLYWLLNERRMPFMPLPPEKPRVGMEEENRQRRFSGEPLPPPLNGSDELKRIVLKACAYNCADRYKDAVEMLNDLKQLAGNSNGFAGFVPSHNVQKSFSEIDDNTVMSETVTAFDDNFAIKYSVNPPVTGFSTDDENTVLSADENTVLSDEGTDVTKTENVSYIATPPVQEPKSVHRKAPTPPPVQPVPEAFATESQKKEKSCGCKSVKIVAAVIAVLLVGFVSVAVALGNKTKNNTATETENSDTFEDVNVAQTTLFNGDANASFETETLLETEAITTEVSSSPLQLEWSVWSDSLPEFVNADEYEIEEKIQYSTRTKQTTASTSNKTMDGWTLERTVESGKVGEWSDWSVTKVNEANGREIETQQLYRYRNLEKTTSSSSTKSGWTLKNTTYTWSDYGNWSDWSTKPVSSNDSTKVDSKTQYRTRSISYLNQYTAWSDWSGWSQTRQSTSDLKKEDSRKVSGYYYFLCPNCGNRSHVYGAGTCYTWIGGCGKSIPVEGWRCMFSPVTWANAGLKEWKGTGRYYTYINGELWFQWTGENGGEHMEYKYATRKIEQVATYGSWSDWSDTAYNKSSTLDVETRTAYRYCTRSQITTYHFERWSDWSNWSTESISASSGKEVDTITQYRYRDEVKATTHYFYRWSEWGPYLDGEIQGSDTVEVRTKKQYRYKSKQN